MRIGSILRPLSVPYRVPGLREEAEDGGDGADDVTVDVGDGGAAAHARGGVELVTQHFEGRCEARFAVDGQAAEQRAADDCSKPTGFAHEFGLCWPNS